MLWIKGTLLIQKQMNTIKPRLPSKKMHLQFYSVFSKFPDEPR